ncbi:Hypothetical protein R9X50_00135500 [Acrodontium crateriforme]|uniref:GAF domain-containing protein n=1 Tax=Acrodontium crateriforme TaxID=150365 RepID=A0AAQ3LYY7_9PEZI|nr:Hypothetical protein R9X50_00135500 [Acrodontium crateriforme]
MALFSTNEVIPGAPDAHCEVKIKAGHSSSAEERARSLELAKYLRSASIIPEAEQTALDDPRLSQDNTLTALAQLGTLRLDCDRAFVSLIDREAQYIIVMLIDDTCAPSDGVYLGTRALPLTFGVCPQTIEIFTSNILTIDTVNVTADRSRYIIRDFCADPKFSNRPYVMGYPHMRSYAEVLLTSASGWVIGSYCVVDTKPRNFDAREIGVLREVASTIMTHLDLMKGKIELNRVERLVRGLGSYVAGHSGLQEQQTQPLLADASTGVSGALHGMAADLGGEGGIQNPSTTQPLNSSSGEWIDPQTAPSSAGSANESFGREDIMTDLPGPKSNENSHQLSPLSHDMRSMFSRAGNLIRQCMGIIVEDAGTGAFNKTKNATSITATISDNLLSGEAPIKCKLLGHSTEPHETDTIFGFTPGFNNINEDVLDRMLARHPFGHIYSFDELGMVSNGQTEDSNREQEHPSRLGLTADVVIVGRTEEGDAAMLFEAFEHARSIFFLPLWDFNKDRWYTAALGWTKDKTRVLDFSDLHYLSAFGNSIQAEVSRIESSALSSA